jgi:bla regulator protein blaR1
MIAAWMLGATLFALLLGGAALAGERALRLLRRPSRGPWFAAMCAAVAWPAIALALPFMLPPPPGGDGAPVVLPAVRTTFDAIANSLPTVSIVWNTRLNAGLAGLWATASLVMLVRLALAMRALARVEQAATPGVVDGIPVLLTSTLGPAVLGVRAPRLLVPRWLLELDAPQRALVLRHEQEHCSARDPQLMLAVALAVAVVPWNVGVWWIARRLRLALELDCDARVLRAVEEPERYGRLLLFIAQRHSHTALAPMLAESNSHLSRRINVMNAPRPAHRTLRVAALAFVTTAALACSARYASTLSMAPAPSAAPDRSQDTAVMYFSPAGARPVRVLKSAAPVYPASLKSARVEGEVHVAFVVDSSGTVLPGSLKVLRSSDSLFTQSVRTAVSDMRFAAAEYNGRKARQLVQQTFYFDLRGSAASGARKAPPAAKPTTDPTNRNPMPLRPVVVTVP